MENKAIAGKLSLLSKLMDIHGDDAFRAKSYSIAAFTINKLELPVAEMSPADMFAIKGIGDRMGKRIIEILNTGTLSALDEYVEKTPPGILEMLSIKGLGPKKIAAVWKEMEIETIGELMYACNENRLTRFKGFGEKTQEQIRESIEFYMNSLGSYLYAQIETYALALDEKLKTVLSSHQWAITGDFKRQMEVITRLEWVTTASATELKTFFGEGYIVETEDAGILSIKGEENVVLSFHLVATEQFYTTVFETSCSEDFLDTWKKKFPGYQSVSYHTEAEIFTRHDIAVVPSCYRESGKPVEQQQDYSAVIQPGDIKGIIHSHSKWSDGIHTIEAMAKAAQEAGLEFLVISDHSKTATYAQGINETQIIAQHKEIDLLNQQLHPFRIFKSIESDILGDGSLDYDDEVLQTFDLVIASIHGNLYMTEDKAMMRLLNAIENPYTNILGHMTGRLLLSRNGYPVNHQKIIDACAANDVVIELNANPRRLDMDWRHIDYALEKGVLISINPDAHNIKGFNDTRYGVLAAQKAALPAARNLSSFSLPDFEKWLVSQHSKRPL